MTYEDVSYWTSQYDLVANRVKIVNQILGSRYDGSLDNPCLLRCKRGMYTCYVCDAPYFHFKAYDLVGIDDALRLIDALADGLWLLARSGRLDFT